MFSHTLKPCMLSNILLNIRHISINEHKYINHFYNIWYQSSKTVQLSVSLLGLAQF